MVSFVNSLTTIDLTSSDERWMFPMEMDDTIDLMVLTVWKEFLL